jgi:hypothetical protein
MSCPDDEDSDDPVVFVKQEPGLLQDSCHVVPEEFTAHRRQRVKENLADFPSQLSAVPRMSSADVGLSLGMNIPRYNPYGVTQVRQQLKCKQGINNLNHMVDWDGQTSLYLTPKHSYMHIPELPSSGNYASGSAAADGMSDVSSNQDEGPGYTGTISGSCPFRRSRSSFTRYQLNRLEAEFKKSHYLPTEARMQLVQELNLQEGIITVWFQNRRQKWKKQLAHLSGNIAEDPMKWQLT